MTAFTFCLTSTSSYSSSSSLDPALLGEDEEITIGEDMGDTNGDLETRFLRVEERWDASSEEDM